MFFRLPPATASRAVISPVVPARSEAVKSAVIMLSPRFKAVLRIPAFWRSAKGSVVEQR